MNNSQERLHLEREQLLLMKQRILRDKLSPTPPYEDLPDPGGLVPGREASVDPFVTGEVKRVPATVNPGHSKLYHVPIEDHTIVVGVSPPPPQSGAQSGELLNYSSVPKAAARPIFEYPPPTQRLSPSPEYLPTVSASPLPAHPSPRGFDDISVIRVPAHDDSPQVRAGPDPNPWHPTFSKERPSSVPRGRGWGALESKQPQSPRRIISAEYNPSDRSRSATPERGRGRRVSQAAVEQVAEAIFNSGVEYRASPARLETGTRNNVNGNPIQPHELSSKKRALLQQRKTLEAELSGTEHNVGRLMVLRDQGGDQCPVKVAPGESIGIEFEETENGNGVIVTRIAGNSPAHRAGIAISSTIIGVDNTSTPNGKSLRNLLSSLRSSQTDDMVLLFDILPPSSSKDVPLAKKSSPPPRVVSPRGRSPSRERLPLPAPISKDDNRNMLELVVQKLDILENRTSHLTELVSRQQQRSHSPYVVTLPPPRFQVGTSVYCKTSTSSWKPGVIIAVNWRGKTWPSDKPSVPYQIRLDGSDALVFAPYDDDRIVRVRKPQSVVYENVDYFTQRPSWERRRERTPPSSSSSSPSDNITSESSSASVVYKTAVPRRRSTAAAAPVKHPCAGPSGRSRSKPTVTGPRFTFTGKIPPRSVRERDHPGTPDC